MCYACCLRSGRGKPRQRNLKQSLYPWNRHALSHVPNTGSLPRLFTCLCGGLDGDRTHDLLFRRQTLYPLSYKGVASFSRLGLTPDLLYVRTTNVESSVEGKSIRGAAAKLLLLVSNQDYGFQRPVCCRYTKEECARTHRTRMPDCVPPCRSNPFLLTGFQALSRGLSLQIG